MHLEQGYFSLFSLKQIHLLRNSFESSLLGYLKSFLESLQDLLQLMLMPLNYILKFFFIKLQQVAGKIKLNKMGRAWLYRGQEGQETFKSSLRGF